MPSGVLLEKARLLSWSALGKVRRRGPACRSFETTLFGMIVRQRPVVLHYCQKSTLRIVSSSILWY